MYVFLAVLELIMYNDFVFNSYKAACLPSVGIKTLYHQAQPRSLFIP